MITYKVETVENKVPESITCDVCKKAYYYGSGEDIIEIQEFHYINFRGGYGSVFGDDVSMKGEICQHCLKKKLGEYLVIDED